MSALIETHRGQPGRLELLEIGAGVGQNVGTLARFGDVDVEEINPLALERLRSASEVRRLFDQPVPFTPTARYDVVCALDVIEHLADDGRALSWKAGLLLPGGVCVLAWQALQRARGRGADSKQASPKGRLSDAIIGTKSCRSVSQSTIVSAHRVS